MVQGTSVYRPIRMSILSGSMGQLSIFFLPAPGIEPRLPAWVESVLYALLVLVVAVLVIAITSLYDLTL